jgi:hypothetical protein
MKRTLALLLAASLAAGPAAAHEQQLHQELTTMAYEIMRLVERSPTSFLTPPVPLPGGVTMADFNAFRAEVMRAAPKLRSMPSGLTSLGRNCAVFRGPTPPVTLTAGFDQWPTLSQVSEPLSWTYPEGPDCGIFPAWLPTGVYLGSTPGLPGVDHTGLTLGMFASAPDDEIDDTHLWYRPTHMGPPVPGLSSPIEVADVLDKGLDLAIASLLAPLLCVVQMITGGPNCFDAAHDIANHLNPIDDLAGAIPGIDDHADGKYTGFWHHINVTPGQSNTYDDVQGMYMDEATFQGRLDAAEIAAIAAADVLGEGIHHRPSTGPKRYQVRRGNDGHADTVMRGESEWQFLNYPHTPMEPLDNLAFFGWEEFRANPATHPTAREARWLAWPLHALGDAASPHHTIGAPGWGHRPMEIAINRAWNPIRFNPPRPLTAADILAQRTQARRIFTRALRWRKLILDWRAADPLARTSNLPIRDLVTALARETHDHAMQTMVTDLWPFDPVSSAVNFLDESALSGHDRANLPTLARPLLENSVAAKLAFLTFATEVQ